MIHSLLTVNDDCFSLGPKDPVCNRSFIKDIGLTNLTLDLSGINTGDVKYISVSYINNYRVNTINITNEASFKYLVTNLTQGSLYFFDIATVGLQNVRSLNLCSVSNYTGKRFERDICSNYIKLF